jgi:signal transduction histidine kinase
MAGDFAAQSFPLADRHLMAELAGTRRTFFSSALADLDPSYRAFWIHDVPAPALAALAGLEIKLIDDTAIRRLTPPVSPLAWEQAIGAVAGGQSKASNAASAAIDTYATNAAWGTARGLLITGSLGLLAVIVSIVVAIFTGRSLVRELRQLRESALDLAKNRLPDVVDRLALGQDVDVAAAAPQLPASTDEVRQVKEAFDTVQRTAVEAAVAQARLRQGMSDVFRNLARRSQSLLHRQLTLLDAMERRARDPQELEDLFRIDHLTTRMRRHAESLIILSGHAPARGWRNPVPLVDVMRAAVAEVEDYTRIKATTGTQASLAGPAVGDVIHMIAELAENATMFSPPNTPVTIHGDIVGQGFAVEIEDRGLGLSEDQIVWINKLLENPPPFDPSSSDQLGLFVAGQLAKRHNIKISMRPSPYGGTTAIVLIPRNLVVTEGGAHAKDPSITAAPSSAPRLGGRHANRDWETGPSDAETSGPLTLVPAAGPDDWPGFDVPALRDPLDTADLGRSSPGSSGLGSASPGAAGLGPAGYGAVGAGLDSRGTGGYGTGGFGAGGLGGADGDEAGLPRRVRQANLAPQLRESTLDEPSTAPATEGFTAPTPEQTRSTMAAIQHGWERGRSVFDAGDSAGNGEPGSVGYGSVGYGSADYGPTGYGPADGEIYGAAPGAGPPPPAGPSPGAGDNGDAYGTGTAAVNYPAPGNEGAGNQSSEPSSENGGSGG